MFTLGRKIDLSYNTNKMILAIALVVAAIGYFVTGDIKSGLYIGGGSFLTWALAREVIPKHEYSAFVCVGISLINIFIYENIQMLVIFWIILLLRLVNGTGGGQATPIDIFSVLAMTIYLSVSMENSIYLIPFILALLRIQKTKASLIALPIAGLVILVESLYFKYFSLNAINTFELINIFFIILLLSFVVFAIGSIDNRDVYDDKGHPIDEDKIKGSQMLFASTIFLLYFLSDASINNIIIYIAIMLEALGRSIVDRKESKA